MRPAQGGLAPTLCVETLLLSTVPVCMWDSRLYYEAAIWPLLPVCEGSLQTEQISSHLLPQFKWLVIFCQQHTQTHRLRLFYFLYVFEWKGIILLQNAHDDEPVHFLPPVWAQPLRTSVCHTHIVCPLVSHDENERKVKRSPTLRLRKPLLAVIPLTVLSQALLSRASQWPHCEIMW